MPTQATVAEPTAMNWASLRADFPVLDGHTDTVPDIVMGVRRR